MNYGSSITDILPRPSKVLHQPARDQILHNLCANSAFLLVPHHHVGHVLRGHPMITIDSPTLRICEIDGTGTALRH